MKTLLSLKEVFNLDVPMKKTEGQVKVLFCFGFKMEAPGRFIANLCCMD